MSTTTPRGTRCCHRPRPTRDELVADALAEAELDELMAAACAVESARTRRLVAQVAVEAIVNHPHDGWDPSTMATVLGEARAAGVGKLYTDMLHELSWSRAGRP